jgi:DNA primase
LADSIRKFSSKKNLKPLELKEFRNYVSQLKKQGKIKGSIDARTARPARLSGGKTLAEIVNANRPSLKQFTPAFKLPKQTPYKLLDLPGLKGKTLHEVLHEIAENPQRYDSALEPGDRIAMEIEGSGTLNFYSDLSTMAEEFEHYKTFTESDAGEQKELLASLKIVRWPANKTKAQYLKQRPSKKRKDRRTEYRRRKR